MRDKYINAYGKGRKKGSAEGRVGGRKMREGKLRWEEEDNAPF